MATIRCGLVLAACLTLTAPAFGQGAAPTNSANPLPFPDTNAPGLPAIPLPEPDPAIATPAPTVAPDAGITNAAPAAAPKPKKKPAAPVAPSVRGTVVKLDNVGMMILVNVKGKEEVYKITSKTRTFVEGKPAILSDGKAGDNVKVEYHTNKDKSHDALTISFGGSAPVEKVAAPAAKKPAKGAPAKKPAKKPATKSIDKPAPTEGVTPLAPVPPAGAEVTPLAPPAGAIPEPK